MYGRLNFVSLKQRFLLVASSMARSLFAQLALIVFRESEGDGKTWKSFWWVSHSEYSHVP